MLLGGCYGQVVAKVNCIPYLVNSRKFMHATRSIVIASLRSSTVCAERRKAHFSLGMDGWASEEEKEMR